jgi:diguanylate cyclase (GGDEF)-like protein
MDRSEDGAEPAPASQGTPEGDLVARARALHPRSWSGEDVGQEIEDLLAEAQRCRDLEGECAARYAQVAHASTGGDTERARAAALALTECAVEADLPLWESRGRHYLAWLHLEAGEESSGIEQLVDAEVLTDGTDEPSTTLAGAINGVATTYMLLGLYEESGRLFDRIAEIQSEIRDGWIQQVLDYNRLLNVATWAISLERVGAGDEGRERLHLALQEADDRATSSLDDGLVDNDVVLLMIFAGLMTGRIDAAEGRQRLDALFATRDTMESEAYAHFALAVRATLAGDFEQARADVAAGRAVEDRVRNDHLPNALRWLAARIAVLEDPDHVGLQQAWDYACMTTQQLWDLRLRRRDAVLDRLHIRRLRREHDRVERASLEDALTGVANRRRLDRERTHLGTTTDAGWTTVIYLDLDGFKQVNDTFGHDLGDDVLKIIADLLRTSVRNHDLVGRYGGDEFVVIAHHCDPDDATTLGERIVSTVRHHPWDQLHPSLQLTVSAGVAVTDDAYAHLFPHADDLLYTAKQTGRDRAIIRTVDASTAARASTAQGASTVGSVSTVGAASA